MAVPISAEEVTHRAASDAELITWVDEQDHPLGSLPRAEPRECELIGRDTFILLFNSAGGLYVQRRTLSKVVYPGYQGLAAGGMVRAGRPYADSATRELEEELRIHGAVLREHGRFFFDEPDNRLWCAVFSAVSDAPLRLQVEEISKAHFIRPELALEKVRGLPYCPGPLQALCLYLDA